MGGRPPPIQPMPAVDRTRLQTQIRLVTQSFASTDEFVKRLSELYEYYSDLTYDPAGSGQRYPTLQAYNVTPFVNRQFEFEFSKLCQENPLSSLDVIDRLWKQEKVEPRKLAAYLLGKMSLEYSPQVIERLQTWSKPTEDRELNLYLQEFGSARLRHEAISEWLEIIHKWLESGESHDQIFGLQSLLPLIQDPDYHDLPKIFTRISTLLANPSPRILFTLQVVIEALAKRFPVETVYTLKLVLRGPHSAEIPRFFRRLLPIFPPEQEQSLRTALKETQR